MKSLLKAGCATLCMSLGTVCFAQTSTVPVLTDASGKNIIGRYVGGSYVGSVILSANNQSVMVALAPVSESTGLTWQPQNIYFASPGCTGPAYFYITWPTSRASGAVAKLGSLNTLFVSKQNPLVIGTKMVYAVLDGQGGCFNFDSPIQQGLLVEAQFSVSLEKLGKPPFYVK